MSESTDVGTLAARHVALILLPPWNTVGRRKAVDLKGRPIANP